ncbi:MAG: alpha/beta fold hydrolase [Verrucomicrobiota bacterium]
MAELKGTIWCLHGAVGMAGDWRGLAVPGWAVKRVDLWRFLDCCPMSLAEFGAALNREAAATEGRKVLLGYSMGGRLALHALLGSSCGESPQPRPAAGRRSHPWDAAVVVSAHPGLDEGREARRAKDAEWAAMALKGSWGEFLAKWEGQSVLSGAAKGLGDRRKLELRRQAVARSFVDWSLGAQEALSERVEEIECPLLWVAGERDAKFRELAERIEQGRNAPSPFELRVVPGAGHRVPWECDEFPAMIGEFLERSLS